MVWTDSTGEKMQVPLCNDLLAALPAQDYLRLEPRLELVSLSAGQVLFRPGESIRHVHFPTSAVVAFSLDLADGNCVDTAMVGHDCAVGLGVFNHPQAIHMAQVRCAGFAYRLRTDAVLAEQQRGEGLTKAWHTTTNHLMRQMGQISACNRHHSLDQRLARWTLKLQDMTRMEVIAVTHQEVAQMLGVRREAITLTAGRFAKAGLLRFERGQLHVLDRAGLQGVSCECHQRLLDMAPFPVSLHRRPGTLCSLASHSARLARPGAPAHAMRMSNALSVMATSV
jgi:CRP-like cAMP-binding protein